MTERPILFSAPMVRAILAGTKTQTRRAAPVEHLSIREIGGGVCWEAKFSKPVRSRVSGGMAVGTYSGGPFTSEQAAAIVAADFCPYGVPGDRLWVRETHSLVRVEHAELCPVWYWADGNPIHGDWTRPRPSIHMPRWASRITLEITGVRVERLQAIDDQDAEAEGAEPRQPLMASGIVIPGQYRLGFRDLWNSINGPEAWDANPWVWVVEFRRVQSPA